jgi:hypothetical protein
MYEVLQISNGRSEIFLKTVLGLCLVRSLMLLTMPTFPVAISPESLHLHRYHIEQYIYYTNIINLKNIDTGALVKFYISVY